MKGQDILKEITVKSGRRNEAVGVKFTCGISGFDELLKDFNELGEDAILELAEPSTEAANIILKKARTKIHRTYNDDNDLYESLKVVGPGRKKGHATQIFSRVSIGKGGAHGVPLELGHNVVRHGDTFGNVKEHPYLRPAADESRDEVANIMTDYMNEIISEHMEKKL